MKFDVKARDKAIKTIEKRGHFKITALVDDGGAFMLPVVGDTPVGIPVEMTYKKLLQFAKTLQETGRG
jgi:hypothetical protein